jgi:hypothetical protein
LDGASTPDFHNYACRVITGDFSCSLVMQVFLARQRCGAVPQAEGKVLNTPDNAEGVFARLWREVGANPHELGVVRINGNHYDDDEMDKIGGLIMRGWRSHWESRNEPNSSVWFDFRGTNRKLRLWKYELQTWNREIGHLVQWVVEGSDDGTGWEELDKRVAVNQLTNRGNRCCFRCKIEKEFGLIRIRQTGPNSSGMHMLNLTGVEFYGELVN